MENKYTRDQIKDAIWQELQESDYTGENNDRAYEIIGIVMAGIDKIRGEAQTGAVWVKAYDFFPVKKRVIAKMFIEQTGITVVGYASSATGEMICFDWNVSSVSWRKGHEDLKNLFWLDESAPSGERDPYAGFRETIENIIHSAGKHNQEQCTEIADAILRDLSIGLCCQKKKSPSGEREVDAVAFNIYCTDSYYYENGFWWHKEGHDPYSVDQLYDIFKQQNGNNENG